MVKYRYSKNKKQTAKAVRVKPKYKLKEVIKMTNFTTASEYLKDKINNSWYKDVKIDYNINGHFVSAEEVENEHLLLKWVEDGEAYQMVIYYYKEYTNRQLYNIWMEG